MTKKIGRYTVRSMIGRGTMGKVYKVIIPGIQKIAALKLFAPTPKLIEVAGMEWLREKFVQEAAIISNIRHPNVVDIWSLEENQNQLFYVMAYYCHSLGTLMGETYWPDKTTRVFKLKPAYKCITDILHGLCRLHQAGIVHQDIKPFNVMFSDLGTVKLVDFGLSKKRGEQITSKNPLLMGTPFYAAPEQKSGMENIDHLADLYSVGVILYRLLTGHLPMASYKKPSHLNPNLDDIWDHVILKSLSANPRDRFQDAGTMLTTVQDVYRTYMTRQAHSCQTDEVFSSDHKQLESVFFNDQRIRSQPQHVLSKHAKSFFKLDFQNRPQQYHDHKYFSYGSKTIIDKPLGLVWERGGSFFPISFAQAQTYIARLNQEKLDGLEHWRFPTVNELLSLLRPPPPGENLCLASIFSSTQKWLWSGDRRSAFAMWVVYMELGFVASSDEMNFFYVKGVSNL